MTTEEFIETAYSSYNQATQKLGKEPNAGRHGYGCYCIHCREDRAGSEEFQNWLIGKRKAEEFRANIIGLKMMLKENAKQEEIEAKKKIICRWLD